MIKLNEHTISLIKEELENIPEKYQKPFNSAHEGLGVLREEYRELEDEIFFGEKKIKKMYHQSNPDSHLVKEEHKKRIQEEAVQVAAMAIRIIQEIT